VLTSFVALSALPSFGQLGKVLGGKKSDQPVKVSDQAPQYSDADKQKMAQLADRPDVKDEIDARWRAQRNEDLEFAYNVNSSAHFVDISGPAFAEFREKYGRLYNNPILQQYVNNIGQRLVPKDSNNVYSFKLLLDPVPNALSLSTGSIYISTGLVAMLDNEAELAYVLGHEIAHVEKNHFYNRIRNEVLEEKLYEEKEKTSERNQKLFALGSVVAGGLAGHAIGGGGGFAAGAGIAGAGIFASQFLFRNKMVLTNWSVIEENEADDAGFKYMLDQSYDAREVPRLYATLKNSVGKDQRVGLGFIGNLQRVQERQANAQALITGAYKAQLDAKLAGAGLKGSSPEFSLIMAALKRDNGIIAMDYDLFDTAMDNLQDAVNLRSNDARAQLFLGKVKLMTARSPQDHQEAEACFRKALQYDDARGAYPDAHLEHALSLIAQNSTANTDEIKRELQTFVALYQREHQGQLPNNMPILYDFFTLSGDMSWYVPPAAVVSTQYVSALKTNSTGDTRGADAHQVTALATGGSRSSAAPVDVKAPAPATKPAPRVKPASASNPQ
jgi:Zn-dependent protease with chaperone function